MRRAGTGLLDWGGRITWTVADGRLGRRWRSMLTEDGVLVGVAAPRDAPGWSVAKLELATAAGLLTLHPEGSTLHGNVVAAHRARARRAALARARRAARRRHAGDGRCGSTAARAAPSGSGRGRRSVASALASSLAVTPTTFRVARVAVGDGGSSTRHRAAGSRSSWTTTGSRSSPTATSWPLELDHGRLTPGPGRCSWTGCGQVRPPTGRSRILVDNRVAGGPPRPIGFGLARRGSSTDYGPDVACNGWTESGAAVPSGVSLSPAGFMSVRRAHDPTTDR